MGGQGAGPPTLGDEVLVLGLDGVHTGGGPEMRWDAAPAFWEERSGAGGLGERVST